MVPDGKGTEYPGKVFSPFVALDTESTGIMIAETDALNFRQRMDTFCARWGLPNVEAEKECVTKDITSLPRKLLKGHLRANATLCDTATSEDEVIFEIDADYVYLGRPLWASRMIHNQKGASWRHMAFFAIEKLLGGDSYLSKESPIYIKQCLAALACRVPLQFDAFCGIAPQMIAEHMAWWTTITWDREGVYLRHINEPLLATAALVLWDKVLAGMLQCLLARYGPFVSNKGDLGEVAACVLLTFVADSAYKKREGEELSEDATEENDEDIPSPAKLQYEKSLRFLPQGLTMFGFVTVKEFPESGFTLRVSSDFKCESLKPIEDLDARKTAYTVGSPQLAHLTVLLSQDQKV